MTRALVRYIALTALLAAVAWTTRLPSWDSVAAALAALTAFLGIDRVQHGQFSRKHDEALFERFMREIPSSGASMRFLSEYDLGNPFPPGPLNELDRIARDWADAEHEFADKRLETQRREFLRLLETFLMEISQHTAGQGPKLLSIGMHDFDTRPEMFRLRDNLNEMAAGAYRAHQEVVRRGRKRM